MRRILYLVLGVFVLGLAGCATEQPPPSASGPVNTNPWNTPERWEGQGPLGSMLPGNGY